MEQTRPEAAEILRRPLAVQFEAFIFQYQERAEVFRTDTPVDLHELVGGKVGKIGEHSRRDDNLQDKWSQFLGVEGVTRDKYDAGQTRQVMPQKIAGSL